MSVIIHSIEQDLVGFHCPGCKYAHVVTVNGRLNPQGATWTWNGSVEKPTFSPSLLVNASHPESRCHSFVKDGQIQFLSDCAHELRGQTVDLKDFDGQE